MDDDKLVSDEVHMRQLSATPSSAFSLQQRRQSNSVTQSAPPELTQRVAALGDTKEEAPLGVVQALELLLLQRRSWRRMTGWC